MKEITLFISVIIVNIFGFCTSNFDNQRIRVEQLMNEQPDSALTILNAINPHKDLHSNKEIAIYALFFNSG